MRDETLQKQEPVEEQEQRGRWSVSGIDVVDMIIGAVSGFAILHLLSRVINSF